MRRGPIRTVAESLNPFALRAYNLSRTGWVSLTPSEGRPDQRSHPKVGASSICVAVDYLPRCD